MYVYWDIHVRPLLHTQPRRERFVMDASMYVCTSWCTAPPWPPERSWGQGPAWRWVWEKWRLRSWSGRRKISRSPPAHKQRCAPRTSQREKQNQDKSIHNWFNFYVYNISTKLNNYVCNTRCRCLEYSALVQTPTCAIISCTLQQLSGLLFTDKQKHHRTPSPIMQLPWNM